MNSKKRQRPEEDTDWMPPAVRQKTSDTPIGRAAKIHGRKKIDLVLCNRERGWIWIMNTRTSFGFAKITNAEWGCISEDDVKRGLVPLTSLYEDELPCTFKQLAEAHPDLAPYFEG